jgi:HAE1 family hydrophobic/amphiphilic exporter-1
MAINAVKDSVIQGAVLAVLVLLFFLKNFRSTFIIATSIPISVIATFAILYFSGITLNLMTLGGLALGVGMLVDNSIVVLENIFRLREEGYSRIDAAQLGAKEVGMAVTASTLTNVAVFLPIVFVEGITSTIFKEMALTVTVSMFASLAVALTLVPMLSSQLLRADVKQDNRYRNKITSKIAGWLDHAYARFESGYGRLLQSAVNHKALTVIITAAIFIGALAFIPGMGREFMPETDEGQISIQVSLPSGAGLKDTEAVLTEIESRLENIPEIETIYSTAGSGSAASFISLSGKQTNTGSVSCVLKDLKERERSTQEVAEEIRSKIYDIPGAEKKVSSFSTFSLGQLSGGSINVQIKGEDINILKAIGDDVSEVIESVDGTREVESSLAEGIPEVQIRVDRSKASQYGLTAAQIASSVRGTISGTTATRFKYQGDEIDVVIQGDETLSQSISNLEQMMISTPAGLSVPLGQVAEIVIERGPVTINRDGQVRVVTVSAQILGRDLGSVSKDIEEKLESYDMPEGYTYELAGENEEMVKAFDDLTKVLILAVLLVYMVLAAQFESLIQPFTIMLSVPIGIAGGIMALAMAGKTLNIASFIGLIMLAGIVVNNAIVLIDYILTLRKEGKDRREAILNAGPVRLRPVLMTTLTTVLGLIPMAIGTGEGSELEAPLAISLIGGLVLSTVITLVFIPVMYSLVDDLSNFFRRKILRERSL